MQNPLFSIIMPVYNVEEYLQNAVESILAQTYADWELIIVDDCSKDNSVEVAARLAQRDSRVRLLCMQSNSGTPRKPREFGILEAKGDYLVFVDADDTVESRYLSIFAENIAQYKCDVVLPIMQFVDSQTQEIIDKIPSHLINKKLTGIEACAKTIPAYQIGCNGMAFKKMLYKHVFDENPYYGSFCDEFSERIILYHAMEVIQSDAQYMYNQNPQSVVHTDSYKDIGMLKVDMLLLEFCRERYTKEMCIRMRRTILSHMMQKYKEYSRNKNTCDDAYQKKIENDYTNLYMQLKRDPTRDHGWRYRILMSNEVLFKWICRVMA